MNGPPGGVVQQHPQHNSIGQAEKQQPTPSYASAPIQQQQHQQQYPTPTPPQGQVPYQAPPVVSPLPLQQQQPYHGQPQQQQQVNGPPHPGSYEAPGHQAVGLQQY